MRNTLSATVCVLCLFSGAEVAHAADSAGVTLEDALGSTMRNNPLVQIERIDVAIAQRYYRENMYLYEPTINGSFRRTWPMNPDTADGPPVNIANIGVSQQVPSGASFSAATSVAPVMSGGYAGAASLSFTQALLQGGGVRLALVPIRRARIDIELRDEELAGYTQRILRDTEHAYWELFLANKESAIRSEALGLAQRLLFETEARLQVGRVAPLELVAVKAEMALREKELAASVTACEHKRLRLLYLMGDSTRFLWSTPLTTLDTPLEPQQPDNVDDHVRLALTSRPDMRLARALVRRSELDVLQTANGLLPRLDFFINLESAVITSSAYDAFFGRAGNDAEVSGGVSFSLPVSSGAARQRFSRARLSTRAAELSVKNMERLIEIETRSAHADLLLARHQAATSQIVLDLQRQRLVAEQEKLAAGSSTNYFVLQAQRELTQAQLDAARSAVSLVTTALELYVKDGSLLQRRGVQE